MVKPTRRQRTASPPSNKTETSDSPPSAAQTSRRRRVPSQSRSYRSSVERPKSRSRIEAVEWQKENRRRQRRKSTFDDKSGTSSRRKKSHVDPEEEAQERNKTQRWPWVKDKPDISRFLEWEARKRRRNKFHDKTASLFSSAGSVVNSTSWK